MHIKITTDSTCDLNADYLAAHDVEVFPLSVICGGKSYLDGVDIVPADIFRHVAGGGELSSTAAVNTAAYRARFEALSREYDAVIHVDISADFSSCYQNACAAAAEFPNVYVVDSRNLSTGHGHIVVQAVERSEAGGDAAQIVAQLQALTGKVEASFVIDCLDYLRKGGRCSTVAALGANLLHLKPCIEVTDGQMHVGKKFRGQFRKAIVDYVHQRLEGRTDLDLDRIFITHSPVDDGVVDSVRTAILECAPFREVIETQAGCTVSSHCGPGTLGILFLRK